MSKIVYPVQAQDPANPAEYRDYVLQLEAKFRELNEEHPVLKGAWTEHGPKAPGWGDLLHAVSIVHVDPEQAWARTLATKRARAKKLEPASLGL